MSSNGSLQVIGAGLGRTGTASLKKALELLGFDPCYHMQECIKKGHQERWIDALNASPGAANWDGIYGEYRAAVGFPTAAAFKDLIKAYPDAKVVLSMREPDKWVASVQDTIWMPISRERSWVLGIVPWHYTFRAMGMAFRKRIFNDADGGLSSGAIADPAALAATFERWNAEVQACVPADRLLVFRPSDGWEPLCKFLGVPVPEGNYPHVNDTAVFKARVGALWRKWAAIEAATVVAVVGVSALVFWRRSR